MRRTSKLRESGKSQGVIGDFDRIDDPIWVAPPMSENVRFI